MYGKGCTPPSSTSWKDPDNNVAFHNKTTVMTHNATISIAAKWLDDMNNSALTDAQRATAKKNYTELIATAGFPNKPDGSKMVYRAAVKTGVIFKDAKNKKRAMEFRDCVIQGGKKISIFAFSSIKAISQYTVEEILEMGIDGFWIGYEGTRSNYAKQQGRPVEEILTEFREHGITILASMIVGLPYQTPQIIEEELAGLLALKPALTQFLIYGPTPGTPFFDRVMREGLLHRDLADDREYARRRGPGLRHELRREAQLDCRDRGEADRARLRGPAFQEPLSLEDLKVVMDGGRIVAEGSPADLIRTYCTREVVEVRFGSDRNAAAAEQRLLLEAARRR